LILIAPPFLTPLLFQESLTGIQQEQGRLRERLIMLEQKVSSNSKKSGFTKFQLGIFAFVALVFGVLAPVLSKRMHEE